MTAVVFQLLYIVLLILSRGPLSYFYFLWLLYTVIQACISALVCCTSHSVQRCTVIFLLLMTPIHRHTTLCEDLLWCSSSVRVQNYFLVNFPFPCVDNCHNDTGPSFQFHWLYVTLFVYFSRISHTVSLCIWSAIDVCADLCRKLISLSNSLFFCTV